MKPELVMTAYTGIMFCKDFSEYHKFVEELLDTPIWTHEFANTEVMAEIKKSVEKEYRNGVFQLYAAAPQLLEACGSALRFIRKSNLISVDATPFEREQAELVYRACDAAIRAAKGGDG